MALSGAECVTTKIYVLKDPRDNSVWYVGKTIFSLKKRLTQHMHESFEWQSKAAMSNKAKWVRELYELGFYPIIEEIETVNKNWIEREMYWISYFIQTGRKLTNMTDGGEGKVRVVEIKTEQILPQTKEIDEFIKKLSNPKIIKDLKETLEKNDPYKLDKEILKAANIVYDLKTKGASVRELMRKLPKATHSQKAKDMLDCLVENGFLVVTTQKAFKMGGRPRHGYYHISFAPQP